MGWTHVGKIESESKTKCLKCYYIYGKRGKIDILVICESEGKGVESKFFFMMTINSRAKPNVMEPMLNLGYGPLWTCLIRHTG